MKNQRGMSPLLVIVLAGSVTISMAVGYYVLSSITSKSGVTDYKTCIEAEGSTQTIEQAPMPSQCMYEGKTYVST